MDQQPELLQMADGRTGPGRQGTEDASPLAYLTQFIQLKPRAATICNGATFRKVRTTLNFIKVGSAEAYSALYIKAVKE